jgi:prevent-host-death family protein
MKEFSIRHVQHHLAGLLEAVGRGEKVRITRRGKVVAP